MDAETRDRFLGWLRRRNAAHAPRPVDPSALDPASAALFKTLADGRSMDDAFRAAMEQIEADAKAMIERKRPQ